MAKPKKKRTAKKKTAKRSPSKKHTAKRAPKKKAARGGPTVPKHLEDFVQKLRRQRRAK